MKCTMCCRSISCVPAYYNLIHVEFLCAACSRDTRQREDSAIVANVRDRVAQQKLDRQVKAGLA